MHPLTDPRLTSTPSTRQETYTVAPIFARSRGSSQSPSEEEPPRKRMRRYADGSQAIQPGVEQHFDRQPTSYPSASPRAVYSNRNIAGYAPGSERSHVPPSSNFRHPSSSSEIASDPSPGYPYLTTESDSLSGSSGYFDNESKYRNEDQQSIASTPVMQMHAGYSPAVQGRSGMMNQYGAVPNSSSATGAQHQYQQRPDYGMATMPAAQPGYQSYPGLYATHPLNSPYPQSTSSQVYPSPAAGPSNPSYGSVPPSAISYQYTAYYQGPSAASMLPPAPWSSQYVDTRYQGPTRPANLDSTARSPASQSVPSFTSSIDSATAGPSNPSQRFPNSARYPSERSNYSTVAAQDRLSEPAAGPSHAVADADASSKSRKRPSVSSGKESKARSNKKTQGLFVTKLWSMLEDREIQQSGLLRWAEDGKGFTCTDPAEFAR